MFRKLRSCMPNFVGRRNRVVARHLFITWDGPQVNYLEGLFIPIFKELEKHGHKFHVLQFSWGSKRRRNEVRNICLALGVPYRSVAVVRRFGPIGPFLTAIFGARHIRAAVRDWKIDTLMPRSLMPALATLCFRERGKLKIVFDADGFAADERVDFAGATAKGLQYRTLREIEAQMLRSADAILTRSEAAVSILQAREGAGTNASKYFVVSNGRKGGALPLVDRERIGHSSLVLCYAGSIGEQYCPKKMIYFANTLRHFVPDLTFKVFTADREKMMEAVSEFGLARASWISIDCVSSQDLPSRLADCDLAFSYRKEAFSTQGVAPIKLGEYLLAGLPIIGTPGVGNTQPLIDADVFIPSDGENAIEVLRWIEESLVPRRDVIRIKCQKLAEEHFSLAESVRRYLQALNSVS